MIVFSAKMSDAETLFGVSVTEFTFKGGAITLKKGEGTFYSNKGKAKVVEGVHTLSFASELQFKIPDTETLLGLVVDTELTTQKVDFEVALKNIKEKPVTIKNPFGKSFGLTFQVIKFNGTIVLKEAGGSALNTTLKSSFSLKGRVQIAEYNLIAAVYFYGGNQRFFLPPSPVHSLLKSSGRCCQPRGRRSEASELAGGIVSSDIIQ